jgi:hypothetical protein
LNEPFMESNIVSESYVVKMMENKSPIPWTRALKKLIFSQLVRNFFPPPPNLCNPKFHCRAHSSPLFVPTKSRSLQSTLSHAAVNNVLQYYLPTSVLISLLQISPQKSCTHSSSTHTCHMTRPSHFPPSHCLNINTRTVSITKLRMMHCFHSPSTSCPSIFPQLPIIEHAQPITFPCQTPSFTPTQNSRLHYAHMSTLNVLKDITRQGDRFWAKSYQAYFEICC